MFFSHDATLERNMRSQQITRIQISRWSGMCFSSSPLKNYPKIELEWRILRTLYKETEATATDFSSGINQTYKNIYMKTDA